MVVCELCFMWEFELLATVADIAIGTSYNAMVKKTNNLFQNPNMNQAKFYIDYESNVFLLYKKVSK